MNNCAVAHANNTSWLTGQRKLHYRREDDFNVTLCGRKAIPHAGPNRRDLKATCKTCLRIAETEDTNDVQV